MLADAEISSSRGGAVAAFARRHRLPCFFTLAYVISWLAWTPYVLSRDGLGVLGYSYPNPPTDVHGELLGILPGAYLGPLSSAFVVTALAEGRAGLRIWLGRLRRWNAGWRWYLFALVAVPLLLLVATLPLPGAVTCLRAPSLGVLLSYPLLLVIQVLTSGLAEEPGWRDFSLPLLQRSRGPVVGTLILGPLWAGWHLPLFLTWWAPVRENLAYVALFALVGVVLSIVITWVFNRTRESLPIAMVLHASHNNVWSVLWPAMFPALAPTWDMVYTSLIAYGGLSVVLLITTRGGLGRRRTVPRGGARVAAGAVHRGPDTA